MKKKQSYKKKLEKLLLTMDGLWHTIEPYRVQQNPQIKAVYDLWKEYGGQEIVNENFWDHVKKASDEVRSWPDWKRKGAAFSRFKEDPRK